MRQCYLQAWSPEHRISLTWEPVSNSDSQVHPRPTGGGVQAFVLLQSFEMTLMHIHSSLRTGPLRAFQ